ncbi:glycosyltransferase family 2 protein [Eubacterium limosum]|uniref:glycosyltransferase family 2 protein n=1 Tax=Eubacterium limosum TaxID=1736 RepID=UPI0015598078|nr:glycosyltransferase family A protein [Eubacterium limosum]
MILSICIPSYNRFDNLKRIIGSLLAVDSDDFEVVIVDNRSSNDIFQYLNFVDKRVKIIKRENSVDGKTNCRQVFDYATGEYVMCLLDKDYLNSEFLLLFIEKLKILSQSSDLTCGFCSLNSKVSLYKIELNKRSDFYYFAYYMRHPSGMFIKKKYIHYDNLNTDELDRYSAFGMELLFASAYAFGTMVEFCYPMIETEKEDVAAQVKSYSYSEDNNNIWFFPSCRIEGYDAYMRHLNKLNISYSEYCKVSKKIFKEVVYACTYGFENIIKNKNICAHYGIKSKNISFKEMMRNFNTVVIHMWTSTILDVGKVWRIKSIVTTSLYLICKRVKEIGRMCIRKVG